MKIGAIKKITVSAVPESLKVLRDFVTKNARKMHMNPRQINGLKLSIDEACSNIIRHAYENINIKNRVIIVEMLNAEKFVETRVIDYGKDIVIDINSMDKPDLQKYVEIGKKGGLGLYLIKKFMDEVERKRDNNSKILMMRQFVQRPENYWILFQRNLQWQNMSLRVKFSVLSTLFISFTLFTLYLVFLIYQKNSLISQFIFNTEKLTKKTADTAASYVLNNQDLNLKVLINDLQKKDPSIIFMLKNLPASLARIPFAKIISFRKN